MCLFFLPESISFLMSARPKNALERINKLYRKMGMEPLSELPEKTEGEAKKKVGVAAVLTPTWITISVLIWISSFTHFFSGSLTGGLGNKILVDIGVPLKDAVGLGAATSPVSAVGILLIGALASKWDPLKLTVAAFAISALGYIGWAFVPPDVPLVYTVACFTAFGHAATFGGILICVARRYGPDTRGTVIGWTQGLGRLGTMAGSTCAGQMMAHHWDRPALYGTMSAVAAIGGIAIWLTRGRGPAAEGLGSPSKA
jgi:MFS family permease